MTRRRLAARVVRPHITLVTALVKIAQMGSRFSAFGPYVPAIDRRGVVVFQATLHDGTTGIFAGSREREPAALTIGQAGGDTYTSHPDVDGQGRIVVYAGHPASGERVLRIERGTVSIVAGPANGFTRIGPLGPTTNEAGDVAFRGDERGRAGIFLARAGTLETIAIAGGGSRGFADFHGLPVVDARGRVLFRADLVDGRGGIYLADSGRLELIVQTGEIFRALGAFPSLDHDAGTVAFSATRHDGGAGIFVARRSRIETVVEAGGAFESVRGGLLGGGKWVFFATPRGGSLGVYRGPDPVEDRLVGIGDEVLGSTVVDLALNSVSLDPAGPLAIRLGLASGAEIIASARLKA
jgi:hypothetical protein